MFVVNIAFRGGVQPGPICPDKAVLRLCAGIEPGCALGQSRAVRWDRAGISTAAAGLFTNVKKLSVFHQSHN